MNGKPLLRSHRVLGYELDRFRAQDGVERVLLQTALHKEDVSPAHMLMPVSAQEVAFETQVRLIEAIEQARFLGLDNDALRAAFEAALQAES